MSHPDTTASGKTIDFRNGVVDQRTLRDAFGRFPTGVTVITARAEDGKCEGITANSFSTVSLDPPLVLWNLRRDARSRLGFTSASHFAIHILSRDQHRISKHFATPATDKFEGLSVEYGLGGCPLLPDYLARFECKTKDIIPVGDHFVWIGEVVRACYNDAEPLIFSSGRFAALATLDIF